MTWGVVPLLTSVSEGSDLVARECNE
jgi:hypothetical protein